MSMLSSWDLKMAIVGARLMLSEADSIQEWSMGRANADSCFCLVEFSCR